MNISLYIAYETNKPLEWLQHYPVTYTSRELVWKWRYHLRVHLNKFENFSYVFFVPRNSNSSSCDVFVVVIFFSAGKTLQ